MNSNIRCIEIICRLGSAYKSMGWIVTLDVLKYGYYASYSMRCARWIVTLDVLKCAIEYENENLAISWIVTLDVLKYSIKSKFNDINMLNSNIRCIEICLVRFF